MFREQNHSKNNGTVKKNCNASGYRYYKRSLCQVLVSLFFIFSQSYAQEYWQLTNGPYGGNVYSLALTQSGRILTATDWGGVLFSDNDGSSWRRSSLDAWTHALLVNSEGVIFAGTRFSGVHRSSDNGDSWALAADGLTNDDINCLAINNNNGHIYAYNCLRKIL
jgi:hypothetical protein